MKCDVNQSEHCFDSSDYFFVLLSQHRTCYLRIVHIGSTYYIHEYILVTHLRMSWTEAQSYCREQYGDLAAISDVEVNSRIADMSKDWQEPFWIGLYEDISSWKWSLMGEHHYTGVVEDYRQWQEDQPDNAGANEYCVSMMEDGFWRDNSCTFVKMPLICFAGELYLTFAVSYQCFSFSHDLNIPCADRF